jgi:hypothetical protein
MYDTSVSLTINYVPVPSVAAMTSGFEDKEASARSSSPFSRVTV